MEKILDEILLLKTICDDASLSKEELALIRSERKGEIKGLSKALCLIKGIKT